MKAHDQPQSSLFKLAAPIYLTEIIQTILLGWVLPGPPLAVLGSTVTAPELASVVFTCLLSLYLGWKLSRSCSSLKKSHLAIMGLLLWSCSLFLSYLISLIHLVSGHVRTGEIDISYVMGALAGFLFVSPIAATLPLIGRLAFHLWGQSTSPNNSN